jgi:hypothetical protein
MLIPLHRWINTYNIRLTALYKFFKWLYSPKFDGTLAPTLAIDSCSKSVNTVTGDRNFRKHIKHNSFTN